MGFLILYEAQTLKVWQCPCYSVMSSSIGSIPCCRSCVLDNPHIVQTLMHAMLILQISVTLVSVGVVLATLSRPSSSKFAPLQSAEDIRRYAIGVGMLVLSVVLTGFMGLLQERTYKKYGPCWKEGVFYTVCTRLYVSKCMIRSHLNLNLFI